MEKELIRYIIENLIAKKQFPYLDITEQQEKYRRADFKWTSEHSKKYNEIIASLDEIIKDNKAKLEEVDNMSFNQLKEMQKKDEEYLLEIRSEFIQQKIEPITVRKEQIETQFNNWRKPNCFDQKLLKELGDKLMEEFENSKPEIPYEEEYLKVKNSSVEEYKQYYIDEIKANDDRLAEEKANYFTILCMGEDGTYDKNVDELFDSFKE